jgi:hypothetical protein
MCNRRLRILLENPTWISVQCPTVVLLSAYTAIRYRLGVVHTVVNRLYRAKICKDGLQIIVAHVAEKPPRHDWIQLPGADFAGVYGQGDPAILPY